MNSREVRTLTKEMWCRGEKALEKNIFDYAWEGDCVKVKQMLLTTGMDVNAKNGKK